MNRLTLLLFSAIFIMFLGATTTTQAEVEKLNLSQSELHITAAEKRYSETLETSFGKLLGGDQHSAYRLDSYFNAFLYQDYEAGLELGFGHSFLPEPTVNAQLDDSVVYLGKASLLGQKDSLFNLEAQVRLTVPTSKASRQAGAQLAPSVSGECTSHPYWGLITFRNEGMAYQYKAPMVETVDEDGNVTDKNNNKSALFTKLQFSIPVKGRLGLDLRYYLTHTWDTAQRLSTEYQIRLGPTFEILEGLTGSVFVKTLQSMTDGSKYFSRESTSLNLGMLYEI